jgi:hypothetical protein
MHRAPGEGTEDEDVECPLQEIEFTRHGTIIPSTFDYIKC